MKRVVNNRQVCHLWANQSQSDARGPSIFFRDSRIYSYGSHYLMGMIHERKGKRFALVNSTGYSTTTAKHTSYTWRALHGNVEGFYSPDPENVNAAIAENDARARAAVTHALKKMKVTSADDIKYQLSCIAADYKNANRLRKLLGRKPIAPTPAEKAAVVSHLKKRLKRWNELNTPEMLAARQAEIDRLDAIKAKETEIRLADQIARFRNGELFNVYGLPFDILRIKDGLVQTSGGAEVPLEDAKRLFKLIAANPTAEFSDYSIGGFKLNSVTQTETDKIIKIGCHKILFSEAYRVLGGSFAEKIA